MYPCFELFQESSSLIFDVSAHPKRPNNLESSMLSIMQHQQQQHQEQMQAMMTAMQQQHDRHQEEMQTMLQTMQQHQKLMIQEAMEAMQHKFMQLLHENPPTVSDRVDTITLHICAPNLTPLTDLDPDTDVYYAVECHELRISFDTISNSRPLSSFRTLDPSRTINSSRVVISSRTPVFSNTFPSSNALPINLPGGIICGK